MSTKGMKPQYEDLEQYKHQYFQWAILERKGLKEVAQCFGRLFDEEFKATGSRRVVTYKQWETRKSMWHKEWRVTKDKAGNIIANPTTEQIEQLEELSLWYERSHPCKQFHAFTENLPSPAPLKERIQKSQQPGDALEHTAYNDISRKNGECQNHQSSFSAPRLALPTTRAPEFTPHPPMLPQDNAFDLNALATASHSYGHLHFDASEGDPKQSGPQDQYAYPMGDHEPNIFGQNDYSDTLNQPYNIDGPWTQLETSQQYPMLPSYPVATNLYHGGGTAVPAQSPGFGPHTVEHGTRRKRPQSHSFYVPPRTRQNDHGPRTA